MYTAHFGLREQPFNITADPRFFYANPGHQEAYTNLLYGIRARKGCITLIGDAGTGKTTLLHLVRERLERTVHTAFFDNTTLTFDELLDFICSAFDLRVKGGRRLEKIQGLNEFLLARLREGGTGVLIIDEAQNLGDEILENLRLLSNFETASEKLLQIILVGQPELEKKLERPELRQLKQRIALRSRLDCLKAQDVASYIHHRLSIAGCERQDVFTPEAIQRVSMYSGGIPRLINTICDNALLTAYGDGQQTISATIIEEAARKLRLRRILAWHPGVRDEANADGTAGYVDGTMLQNGLEQAPQALAAGPGRSWVKRLTWIVAILLLLPLLRVGSLQMVPQQNRERTTTVSMGASPAPVEQNTATVSMSASPAPVEQNTAESHRQESRPSPQDTSSLSASMRQPESSTEEPPRSLSLPQPMDFQASEWQGQSITIARGDTIAKIVFKVYGNYNVLALALIKEFNPHLEDLDRIIIGERIWLPFLTRETLLRPQADGSYHLIIGVFHSKGEAERMARRAVHQGYAVTITQQRMSGTRLLQRVELEKLPDLAAVDRAWDFIGKDKM